MLTIRIIAGIYLFIHGISHFVGFIVPWKIVSMEDQPYSTMILLGSINAGAVGVRIIGVLWLITGIAFMISSVSIFTHNFCWKPLALYLPFFSLVLCIIGLPGARIGIPANAIIIIFMILSEKFGWL